MAEPRLPEVDSARVEEAILAGESRLVVPGLWMIMMMIRIKRMIMTRMIRIIMMIKRMIGITRMIMTRMTRITRVVFLPPMCPRPSLGAGASAAGASAAGASAAGASAAEASVGGALEAGASADGA